jgi:ABC-type glycerol-3-phosphate transport system permease component
MFFNDSERPLRAGEQAIHSKDVQQKSRRRWRQRLLEPVALYLLASALAVVFMIPFLWLVSSSLKKPIEIYIFPPVWIPQPMQWVNYAEVMFGDVPFLLFLQNTVVVTTLAMIGQLLSATLVAYGFARFEFPGRDMLFVLVLSTLMLPDQVTLIPQYLLYNRLGWLNTYLPLIVPVYFGGGAFSIFLLRQFLRTLPRDLDEAAILDGCSSLGVLWRVLLPLTRPALGTLAIFSFIYHWNDFIGPLIYLNNSEKFTLSLGLSYFRYVAQAGVGEPQEHLLMAASVLMVLPVIVLFFLAQRYFVQGVVLSGVNR